MSLDALLCHRHLQLWRLLCITSDFGLLMKLLAISDPSGQKFDNQPSIGAARTITINRVGMFVGLFAGRILGVMLGRNGGKIAGVLLGECAGVLEVTLAGMSPGVGKQVR